MWEEVLISLHFAIVELSVTSLCRLYSVQSSPVPSYPHLRCRLQVKTIVTLSTVLLHAWKLPETAWLRTWDAEWEFCVILLPMLHKEMFVVFVFMDHDNWAETTLYSGYWHCLLAANTSLPSLHTLCQAVISSFALDHSPQLSKQHAVRTYTIYLSIAAFLNATKVLPPLIRHDPHRYLWPDKHLTSPGMEYFACPSFCHHVWGALCLPLPFFRLL